MVKEAKDQIAAMTKSRKSSVGLIPDLLGVFRCRVEEVSLHIAVASFFRIQVRGVARQHLHQDLGVFAQIGLHLSAAMDLQAIPNHDERAWDPAPEVPEEDDEISPVDRMIEVPLVDPT
jgi:hypothetical protein